MTYHFEQLSDDTFQKLCQAILKAERPLVQCLPVSQRDGGRDAIQRQPDGLAIYQVKFSLNAATKSERDAIADLIRLERSKIEDLVRKGATESPCVGCRSAERG